MRIALLLSGFIRQFHLFVKDPFVLEFCKRYQPDIFISIWNTKDLSDPSPVTKTIINDHMKGFPCHSFTLEIENFTEVDQSILRKDAHNYTSQHQTKQHRLLLGWDPEGMIFRMRSCYYKIQKAFSLIPNTDAYDLIVKFRPDFVFLNEMVLEKFIPYTDDNRLVHFSDWFVFGKPSVMKIFVGLYDWLFQTANSHIASTVECLIPRFMNENGIETYPFMTNSLPFKKC